MKFKSIILIFVFVVAGLWIHPAFGVHNLPVALIPETQYGFTSVLEGNDIVHDFVVQNTGDAPLFIENVRTDCGCTTVSYPKRIPSGGKGKITVNINTTNYGGRDIRRQVVVQTNDDKNPRQVLIISGFVEKFAEVNPCFAKLKGAADQSVEASVTITPSEKYPFRIVDVSAKKGDNIRFSFKEAHSKNRDQYVLMVKNIKNKKGRYVDKIYLKTNSTIRPVIEIGVVGIIS
jgi:hypothetical protein